MRRCQGLGRCKISMLFLAFETAACKFTHTMELSSTFASKITDSRGSEDEKAVHRSFLVQVLLRLPFLLFLPPFSISRWPAFSARLCSVFLINPAEYFYRECLVPLTLDRQGNSLMYPCVLTILSCRGRVFRKQSSWKVVT